MVVICTVALERVALSTSLTVIAVLSLVASMANAASPWEGEFRSPFGKEDGQTVYWVFKTRCNVDDECKIASSFMKDGKILPATAYQPRTVPSALTPDAIMTKMLRISVEQVASAQARVSGPSHYNAAIYPQIGSPDRVLECRSSAEEMAVICRLDRPLVDAGNGQLSAWVLLVGDMSSGAGCPGAGSVCPAVLLKK